MQRLTRNPMKYDSLRLLAAYVRPTGSSLTDQVASKSFVADLRSSVEWALSQPHLLRGIRVEAMFKSLLTALDGVRLVKDEDSGEVFSTTSTPRPPDLSVVPVTGRRFLVEVKNHYPKNPDAPFSMRCTDLAGLTEYASLMDCDLLIAVYWARHNRWSLCPWQALKWSGTRARLGEIDSVLANLLGDLGDVALCPRYPLTMRVNIKEPRRVADIGEPGQEFTFEIQSIDYYCAGGLLDDARDISAARYMMLFGGMEAAEPFMPIDDNDLVSSLHYDWKPAPEDFATGAGAIFIGTFSSIYSAVYLSCTEVEGQMAHVDAIMPGDVGQLLSLESDSLRIVRVKIAPALTFGPGGEPIYSSSFEAEAENEKSGQTRPPAGNRLPHKNEPCWCGSGRRFKRCHGGR
jgi:hypothetical protein